MKKTVHKVSLDDLDVFSKQYVSKLQEGDVVSLTGVIGTGKTTFLRHLLSYIGLSLESGFSSPTFTILNQYNLPDHMINHIDLYRLNAFDDLYQIDLIQCFEDKANMTFVEWGDKFDELKQFYTKFIHFDYIDSQPNVRQITCYE